MHSVFLLIVLLVMTACINVPLGYLRQNYEKFSFGWYFYVHISIPAIIYFRIKFGISWKFIPFTLAAAVLGQVLGGKLKVRRDGSG